MGAGNLTCTAISLSLLGPSLVGLNRESMESNFDTSEVTRFKNWRWATHAPALDRIGVSDLQSFALTNRSFSDLSLRCDSLSRCWFCIRCHFPIGIFFRLGKAGWYCVTKGSSFLRANLFLCWGAVFLSTNLREVLSHNYSGRVASFYQAIFEISDIFLNIGLRRILKSSEALALLL